MDRFITQLCHLDDAVETVVERLVQFLRAEVAGVHRRKKAEVAMAPNRFTIIQAHKTIVIEQRIEKGKMLGLREVDLLKDNGSAFADRLRHIAFPEDDAIILRNIFAQNEFIQILGTVDRIHDRQTDRLTDQLA